MEKRWGNSAKRKVNEKGKEKEKAGQKNQYKEKEKT